VYYIDNLVVAEGNCEIEKVAQRAAYVKYLAREIKTEDDYSLLAGKTFSCFGANDTKQRDKLVESIKKKTGAKVSLESPDYQIIMIPKKGISNNSCNILDGLVGLRVPQQKVDWIKRLISTRKFFHPSMLEPRLCRAMVNLARVKEGDTIVDPFCGTGSILIEAQEFRIKSIGYDILSEMCKGAKRNLIENVAICDAVQMPLNASTVDAIITDVPYGRSTKLVKGYTRQQMLKDFIDNGSKSVKKMVIMCQMDDEDIVINSSYAMKKKIYHLYRHKSLTRSIVTLNTW
jgi:tRNA (guanine10-N2)-dimethyltransferase